MLGLHMLGREPLDVEGLHRFMMRQCRGRLAS